VTLPGHNANSCDYPRRPSKTTGPDPVVHNLTVERTPIVWRYLSPHAYLELSESATERPVAAVIHGDFTPPARPWPQIRSELSPLDGAPRIEVMLAATDASFERRGLYDTLIAGDFMIAGARMGESGGESLTRRSERIYDDLFELIKACGYPHILRTWNVIEDINRDQGGLERYRQFCLGRHEAFQRHRPDLTGRYPAASAIGSTAGGLNVYFIAAKVPGTPIENPNQVSAFHYPVQYGPRSPSFSRALAKAWADGEGRANLFISGTASISGHETRHVGNLAAQIDQTLENLETLVAEAGRKTGIGFDLRNPDSLMKAYVRRPEDFAQVRDAVTARLGDAVGVLYLRADICREALLVEIDGVLTA